MINLLPPQLKEDYRYARRNASLLHILSMFGIGLVGLVIVVAAGLAYLQQISNNYAADAAKNTRSLQDQKQTEVEKQVQDISNSLKLAVQVLSKEVLFSQLLKQLSVITPTNASLSGININQLQGGVDITAQTTDYNAATQLQVNLQDPDNQIFTKADIVNITCASGSGSATPKYPCTVTMRALFAKNNPFLFINSKVVK